MTDRQMTDFLAGVVGVVEANSYEMLCLWQEHQGRGSWIARADGLLEQVGELGDMPVCLRLTTAVVDGHKLLFINATSQVVDHRMIEKWLADSLPETARKRGTEYINKVDAMNFHNVIPRTVAVVS